MVTKNSLLWPMDFFGRSFSVAMQTGMMLMSSAEVIDRRTQLFSRSLRGEIPFPFAECMLMWQEKLAANIELMGSLNRTFLSSAPTIFQNLQGLPEISGVLTQHMRGIEDALKPFRSRAAANARRLRKGA